MVLFSACMLFTLLGFSQRLTADKVPAPVKQAFSKKFPGAAGVQYGMGKKGYEILFREHGVEKSATFDTAGNWLETETAVTEADIPGAVVNAIVKDFTGFAIFKVLKVELPGKDPVYKTNLMNETEGFNVEFSARGDLLKKEPLKKEKPAAPKKK